MCHLQSVPDCSEETFRTLSCAPFKTQGMVFFAFGFNLVDCGGLLGGRLDSGDTKLPAKKVSQPVDHPGMLH